MAPDRHVARVRRKLPGHHNRRYKGKNLSYDRKVGDAQRYNHQVNLLSQTLNHRMRELEKQASPVHIPLLEAATWLLLDLGAEEWPEVWLNDERLNISFSGVYIELLLNEGSVEAQCFTDEFVEYRTYNNPLRVSRWLRSALKRRDSL